MVGPGRCKWTALSRAGRSFAPKWTAENESRRYYKPITDRLLGFDDLRPSIIRLMNVHYQVFETCSYILKDRPF